MVVRKQQEQCMYINKVTMYHTEAVIGLTQMLMTHYDIVETIMFLYHTENILQVLSKHVVQVTWSSHVTVM